MLSIYELRYIRSILEKGWDAKTSYCATEYTGQPKSLGQCYVTARTLCETLGWKILYNCEDGNNHYWNELPDGLEIDFTSDQIGGDGIFPPEEIEGRPRKFKPINQCKSINPRLKLYLDRVQKPLANWLETFCYWRRKP